MTSTSILIRFIRKNATSKNDDKIVIKPLGNTQFRLTYNYGDSKSKQFNQLVLTDKAVFRWMRTTIGLLEKDNDPFDSVQLDLPFMPSVLFDIAKLGDAYHVLLDALEFHLDNVNKKGLSVEVDREGRREVYNYDNYEEDEELEEEEEEEDEDVEMEEDEYADMPPLIAMPSPIRQRGSHHLFLDEDY